MKSKFTRINPRLLLGLTAFASTIMPVTSAVTMLPMGSEIFQSEAVAIISTDKKVLTVDDAFSREKSLTIENVRIIAFSDRAKRSSFINEGNPLNNGRPAPTMIFDTVHANQHPN